MRVFLPYRSTGLMFVFSVFPLMMHCSSDDTSDRVDETGRAVTLSLDSTLNKFYVNDVIRYRAITTSSDGRIADVTGSAQWALAHEVTAKFESSGTVRGLAVGVTKLTVTFEGQTVELDITVRDLSEEIKSIAVEPSSGSIPKDYSIPLMAKGLYVDGQARDISALCEWKTLTPAIVEIRTNSIGPQLHGVEIGEAKVEAGFAGLTGEGFYSVELLGLEEIEVFPFDLVLPLGSTYQLLGLGRFQKGELMEVTDSLSWISSDPTKLEVSDEAGFKGALTAVGEGFATISATSVGSEAVVGSCTVAVTSAHVESLTVDPAFVNIHAGTSAGMTAAAVLGGGYALDVTELATWTIADETVATIHSNPEGGMILEAVSSGATSMTISYSDATVEQPITIKEAVLVSLNLFTAFEEIPSGGDAEFYLLGIFGDNTQGGLTDVATWASSNPDVAFVSNYPNAGKVKGLFPGETTITASYGDFSVNADLTVTSAEVVSVQAMPAISAVPLGDQVNYNAVAIFSDNSVRSLTSDATWSSSNSEVAMISNAESQRGMAKSLSVGETTIKVELDGFEDTATLRVREAEITFAFATPDNMVLIPGRFSNMQAFANYTNGSTLLVTNEAVWTSDDPIIVQVSNADGSRGKVTGIGGGTTTIRANINGSQASREVKVLDAKLLSLGIRPEELKIPAGFSLQTGATGSFDIEVPAEFSDYTNWGVWSSADDAIAMVGSFPNAAGRVRAVSAGDTTITVGYGEITDTVAVVVDNRTLASLTIGPPNPTLPVDYLQPFVVFGTFDDGSSFQVTVDVEFESSDSTIATVVNQDFFPGTVSTVRAGEVTLTAKKGDITTTTVVKVVEMEAESVVVAPVSPVVARFTPYNFSATGVFPDGSTADFTNLCTWTSSDPTVFLAFDEAFVKGMVFGFLAGTGEIKVRCGAVETSTSVTFF